MEAEPVKPRFLALLLCVCLFSGCWSHSVIIESKPAGSEVYLDGDLVGNSPVTVSLWQGGFLMPWQTIYELKVTNTGYRPYSKTISLAGQFWVEGEMGQWPDKMTILLKKP